MYEHIHYVKENLDAKKREKFRKTMTQMPYIYKIVTEKVKLLTLEEEIFQDEPSEKPDE